MDNWSEKQIKQMKAGGNQQCNDFLKKYGIPVDDKENLTISDKYDSPAAELYKEVLLARVEGRVEPTELPQRKAKTVVKKKMEGFGSSAAPASDGRNKRRKWLRTLLYTVVPIVVVVGVVVLVLFL